MGVGVWGYGVGGGVCLRVSVSVTLFERVVDFIKLESVPASTVCLFPFQKG